MKAEWGVIIFGILLVIGILPVIFSLKIEAHERTQVFFSIKIFWGLVVLQFPRGTQGREKEVKDVEAIKPTKKNEKSMVRFVLASRKRILRAVRGTLKQLRFRKMQGRFEFGFEDPATTGEILGVVATMGAWLPKHCGFDLAPNFMRKVFRGNGEVVFYIFPLFALFAIIYFWSILAVDFLYFHGSKQ